MKKPYKHIIIIDKLANKIYGNTGFSKGAQRIDIFKFFFNRHCNRK